MQTYLRLLLFFCIIALVSFKAIAQAPTDGLVAYYPFNGFDGVNDLVKVDWKGVYAIFQSNCSSIKSGLWTNPSVWSCNQVPTSSDVVQISTGHTIIIPTNITAKASRLIKNGKLIFEGPNSHLALGSPQAPISGLVAYYPFNGNANDLSGNENHGAVNGAMLTTDRFDQQARAYEFDGNTAFIAVKDTNILDLTTELTFSLWIYQIGAADRGYRLIDKISAGTADGYGFDTRGDFTGRRLRLCGADDCVAGSSLISLNEWQHVALSFKNGTVKFFINGKLDGTALVASSLAVNSLPLLIGSSQGNLALNEKFKGKLDDIRIYNRALSETEIAQLFEAEAVN